MKKIILIDNGHGIETPGKRSPDGKLREYKWCREIANRVHISLVRMGYDARIIVPEDKDIPLAERCKRVNDICKKYGKKNVILLSIHNNAAGNGSRWMTARGWAAYTTKGITEADRFASCLYDAAEMLFKSPLKVRKYSSSYMGRDFEENFYILMHSYCPAVLVENFFQDNKEDVAYLTSEIGKRTCAEALVRGILNYMR